MNPPFFRLHLSGTQIDLKKLPLHHQGMFSDWGLLSADLSNYIYILE